MTKKLVAIVVVAALAGAVAWLVLDFASKDVATSPDAARNVEAMDSSQSQQQQVGFPTDHAKAQVAGRNSRIRTVLFRDGSQLGVPLRLRKRFSGPVGNARLSEQYEQLARSALAGNAEAAFKLSQALGTCTQAYRSEADLAAAVRRLYASGELMLAGRKDPLPADPDHLSEIENDLLRKPFEFCEGISDAQLEEQKKWLELAAEADFWPARIQYASSLGDTYEAIAEWQRNWQLGHVHALSWIDKIYRGGPENSTPDPATAYAYLYADALLQMAYLRDDNSPEAIETRSHYENLLASRGALLSPREMELAIVRGEAMLRENRNCCFWP